jgi:hypothetical protein
LVLQHGGVDDERKPGRPRKWSSDAERMRAYRDRQRDRAARLVDPAEAPEALIENRKLRERVDQLEDERDRLWSQIVRLQAELRARAIELATSVTGSRPSDVPTSRAERRRREREAARRERRQERS